MALAHPERAWLQADEPEPDEEFDDEPWFESYFRAFEDLRFDRSLGGMGAEGMIHYQAISRWCHDHAIVGADFARFKIFIRVIDAEDMAIRLEQQPMPPKPNP